MLGMYVHTHWAYNHPYAARTWTLEDWDGYMASLAALGYDFIVLWPQLDCMPGEPNPSDRAYLAKIGRVIDRAHHRYGMRFMLTAAPNTIGNQHAHDYAFEHRPYFVCERKIDPSDPNAVVDFLAARRRQFASISHADGLFVIDSDPGGYIDSTNDQFVNLMKAQIDILRETNPNSELVYWMWVGWENYNAFWKRAIEQKPGDPDPQIDWNIKDFLATLPLLQQQVSAPWSVTSSNAIHNSAIDQVGLGHSRLFFPYGLIEGEPTFPLTNLQPDTISARLSAYAAQPEAYPRGVIASSQTHCVQLPGAYLFSHFAKGGSLNDVDLSGFASRLLPEIADAIARAWNLIENGDADAQRKSADVIRAEIGVQHITGDCSGLLFGDADRFLADLADNLYIRAALTDLKTTIDGGSDIKASLTQLLMALNPYHRRVGFVDAYYGPMRTSLNDQIARLDIPVLNTILADFTNWRVPAVRNGVVSRLFDALAEVAS